MEIPYKGKSLMKGNPLWREIHHDGISWYIMVRDVRPNRKRRSKKLGIWATEDLKCKEWTFLVHRLIYYVMQCFRNFDSKDLGLRDLGMRFRRMLSWIELRWTQTRMGWASSKQNLRTYIQKPHIILHIIIHKIRKNHSSRTVMIGSAGRMGIYR